MRGWFACITPMPRMPSASKAATVWSIRLTIGAVKITELPLAKAPSMILAATRVLPNPTGP